MLARAVELDSSPVTVTHLRQTAAEAGIAAEAFEAALAEFRNAFAVGDPNPARQHSLRQRVTVSDSRSAALLCAKRVGRRIAGNVGSLAAAWLTLRLFGGVWSAVGAAWTPPPVGFAVGLALAARAPGDAAARRPGDFTGRECVMDLAVGTHVVQGLGAHAAIAIAGIAGVFLGARLTRQRPERRSGMESSTSERAANQRTGDATRTEPLLTLRAHPI